MANTGQLGTADSILGASLVLGAGGAGGGGGDGSVIEQDVSHGLAFTQTLTLTRLLDVETALALEQSNSSVAAKNLVSSLILDHEVETFLFIGNIHHLSHTLDLVQLADGDNADVQEVEHSLGFTQSVSLLGPIYVSAHSILSLVHQALGTLGVPWLPIEIEQPLGITDHINIAVPVSAASVIVFVDGAFNRYTAQTNLGFSQTAVGGRGYTAPAHNVSLAQAVVLNGTFLRSLDHANFLQQAVTYFIDDSCARKNYNRYQGEGAGSGIAEKPLQFDSDFVLESLSGPKTIVRLRSPEMDDRDRLGFNRINRETRGGELNVYSDPAWPKINTLLVTIVALKQTKIEELQSFLLATLGQQIKLHDWQGRVWIGVITTPGDVATEDAHNAWTVTFEFEGEPYEGQAIDDRIPFTQSVLPIGPVEQESDPGALALDQIVGYTLETA